MSWGPRSVPVQIKSNRICFLSWSSEAAQAMDGGIQPTAHRLLSAGAAALASRGFPLTQTSVTSLEGRLSTRHADG